ncbi:MAG: formate dehydrogenase subunit gamma [Candidatus Binatia bacterium]
MNNERFNLSQRAGAYYMRWSRAERIQHWILALSFLVLVITGFALRYPDTWWVRPFTGYEWLFNLRGVVHRIAGASLILLGLYHVTYLAVTARGRLQIAALRPRLQDVRQALQNLRYNLGASEQKPKFGHYSYFEKVEYWALVWGTMVMGTTGLMLWFFSSTLRLFPRWVIDLATVIHLYEAWLASLAIVVWHFYYVVFNPDVYPLDSSMLNGLINEEELLDGHAAEWEALQKQPSEPRVPTPDCG